MYVQRMRPADTARQCCSGSTGRVNCSSKVVKRRMSHQRVLAAQNHTADAYQPSAVITGCSSGIGQGAALMLAQQGWRVFAGARSESSLLQLQELHPDISPIPLDVTKSESIAAASDLVQAAVGDKGLQLLVNNAGVGVVAPLEHLPLSEYRAVFDVNLFGVVSTSQAFIPLLRHGPVKGRIINVGSVAGHLHMPFWSAYCSSKAALEAVSECLRFELAAQGVPVVVIKPGPVATAIWDKSGHRSAQVVEQLPPAAREMYGLQIDTMLQQVQLTQQKASPVDEVLQTIYTAATCLEPPSKYHIGDTAALYHWMKRLLPDWLWEQMLLSAYGDAFQKRRS